MITPSQYIFALINEFPCLVSKMRGWRDAEFDPDKFYAFTRGWSHGEKLCALFVLNVWNPGYAKQKKWKFDLFDFIGTVDAGNVAPVLEWMQNPYWP